MSITQSLASHRQKKDVSSDVREVFGHYIDDITKLKEFHDEILDKGTILEELAKEENKTFSRGFAMQIVVAFVIAFLFFLLGKLL